MVTVPMECSLAGHFIATYMIAANSKTKAIAINGVVDCIMKWIFVMNSVIMSLIYVINFVINIAVTF
jgi:hypothetical protein